MVNMLFKVNMFCQRFTISALLLLLATTTATVAKVPPECDGLGKSRSQIGSNETITAGAIELCGTANSPYVCNLGCFVSRLQQFQRQVLDSHVMYYKFDQVVHNITTVQCMEHFNQTKETCNKGGTIDFMVRDDAVLNGTPTSWQLHDSPLSGQVPVQEE